MPLNWTRVPLRPGEKQKEQRLSVTTLRSINRLRSLSSTEVLHRRHPLRPTVPARHIGTARDSPQQRVARHRW